MRTPQGSQPKGQQVNAHTPLSSQELKANRSNPEGTGSRVPCFCFIRRPTPRQAGLERTLGRGSAHARADLHLYNAWKISQNLDGPGQQKPNHQDTLNSQISAKFSGILGQML